MGTGRTADTGSPPPAQLAASLQSVCGMGDMPGGPGGHAGRASQNVHPQAPPNARIGPRSAPAHLHPAGLSIHAELTEDLGFEDMRSLVRIPSVCPSLLKDPSPHLAGKAWASEPC